MRSLDAPLMEKHKSDTIKQLKFLEFLPLNNYNVKKSAIEAGYAESTAIGHGKTVLRNALAKALALKRQEMLSPMNELTEPKKITSQVLDITGLSQEDIIKHYRFIVEQEKDLPSKLKALAPLLKELGINLIDTEANKTIVPILNIGIREQNTATDKVISDDDVGGVV